SELLGIHVEDKRAGVKSVTFQVSMWDPNTQMTSTVNNWHSMQTDVSDINAWKTVTTFADQTGAGLSRGQTDAWKFGYTLAASVEGTAFTATQVDARTVQLQITPAASYTIWIACASRQNAAGNNSAAQATALLAGIKTAGYAATLAAYKAWWHAFWAKSFVQFSNTAGDADFLENYYYLANYLVASGSYGKYPFQFINGVYHSNADLGIDWSGGYWYWNQRDVLNSFLASNRVDVIDGYYKLYSDLLPKLKALTQSRFKIDGVWTPETIRWDGDATWTTSSTFTDNIFSTGGELSNNMFDRFEYTQDSAFLKNTAYPYMKESAKFLAAKYSYNASTKQYSMASSNVHETYWDVPGGIIDYAAVRSLFPNAIKSNKALNDDPALAAKWQDVHDNIAPLKTEAAAGGMRYLAYDPPTVTSHNGENVASEILWPYGITGIGAPDFQTALNTFNTRPFQNASSIMPDGPQADRAGLGDVAFTNMKAVLSKNVAYPNGLNNTNGVRFEFMGMHMITINEGLLQSYNDTIRVFPAVPTDASFAGKFTLLAKGGFLVSSEKEAGEIKYVGLKSQYGGRATVVNPWGTQEVRVSKAPDNSIVASGSGAFVSFSTAPGEVDILERTAKPLDAFAFGAVTASPNYSAKSMTYSAKTVSLGQGQGKSLGIGRALARQAPSLRTIMAAAGDRVFIPDMAARADYALEVYTLSGQRVKTGVIRRAVLDIQRDFGISNGVYILRIRAQSGLQ
ncbi:MAG: carbohydrate binding family 6, partial [Fibrobacteres bacterium]|nr:carbohydrate binding family 6 [Fibrobacterota bacterium]